MYFCTVSQIVIVQSCTMLLVHLTVKYMYERCDVTQSQCLCLRHVTRVCVCVMITWQLCSSDWAGLVSWVW